MGNAARLNVDFCSQQRTHKSRSRSTPAAVAEAGSKLSLASTSARTSSRCLAWASAASMTPVRPDEVDPEISLSAPRGSPPVSASRAGTPVEMLIGVSRSRSNKVDARPSPSMDSIWARKIAGELAAKTVLVTGITATDDIKNLGTDVQHKDGLISLFVRLELRFCYG